MAFHFAVRPAVPGSVVKEQVLHRMNVSQADLARAMGLSTVRISQLVNGHAGITVETALRLGQVTDTEPEYWLGVQTAYDLFEARQRLSSTLAKLSKLQTANSRRVNRSK